MHIRPLLDDLARIHGLDRGIGAAVPHGDFRPRAAMRRRIAHQIAPFASRPRLSLEHAFEGFRNAGGAVIGQACDDGTAGEHLRIGRQHGRCHRSAGGKAGDEDAAAVDAMPSNGMLDHLADRMRLAVVAFDVAGLKPVEAALGIVGLLLLGIEQDEAVAIGQRGPARAVIVAGGRLRAAMENHHEGRGGGDAVRHIGQHAQIARIGAEAGGLRESAWNVRHEQWGCGGTGRFHHGFPLAPVTPHLLNHFA